jgi:protein-S-isoprenylcysteine O-methyltransferase Ste14
LILDWIERIIRWVTGLVGLTALVYLLISLMRGSLKTPGRTSGQTRFLRSPAFYILISLLYFTLCILIWRPLGINPQGFPRILFLAAGVMIFTAGLALLLWARLTLGRFYFGSTSMGAQLFEGHRLVTKGPFTFVRHPMYIGMLLVGIGGILLYQTWTMVFFALHFPGLVLRARREEQVLAAEFGQEWSDYCKRVPPWLPRIS